MSSIVANNQIANACQIDIAKYSDWDIEATWSCRISNSWIYNFVRSYIVAEVASMCGNGTKILYVQ